MIADTVSTATHSGAAYASTPSSSSSLLYDWMMADESRTTSSSTSSSTAVLAALNLLTVPLQRAWQLAGLRMECMPASETLLLTCLAIVVSIVVSLYQWRRRLELVRKLQEAEASLRYLNDKLLKPASSQKKEIRIFMVRVCQGPSVVVLWRIIVVTCAVLY